MEVIYVSELGYNESIYLIHIGDEDYLIIDRNSSNSDYLIGSIVTYTKEDKDVYLSISKYNISNSPLYKTFLFKFFLEYK